MKNYIKIKEFFQLYLKKLRTKEGKEMSTLIIFSILVSYCWWVIIRIDYFLTSHGLSVIFWDKIVNIRHIFIPLLIISFIIIIVTLFYITGYFILRRKTPLINSNKLKKNFHKIEKVGKIVPGAVLIIILLWTIFYFYTFYSNQVYLDFAPKKPIEEVIIITYGNIPNHIVNAATAAIEKETRLQVIMGDFYTAITPRDYIYSYDREQFSVEKIWALDKSFSGNLLLGNSQRVIKIVDIDLYTETEPEKPYVFSKSMPNVQTILISIYRLQKTSDIDDGFATEELVKSRIRKIVLQELSRSVSLYPFSLRDSFVSTEIDCITVPKNNLSDLDKGVETFSKETKNKNLEYYFRE